MPEPVNGMMWAYQYMIITMWYVPEPVTGMRWASKYYMLDYVNVVCAKAGHLDNWTIFYLFIYIFFHLQKSSDEVPMYWTRHDCFSSTKPDSSWHLYSNTITETITFYL